MKKSFLLISSIFLLLNSSFAQNPLVKQWDYRYGGNSDDGLGTIVPITDGGYILGGTSSSGVSGNKTQPLRGTVDYWIVKIDSLGIKQWDKDYGGPSINSLTTIGQTGDGGYILGGFTISGIGKDKTQASQGDDDYWIVKIDSVGNKQWDKDFGGTDEDFLFSVKQTKDGGYILGGWSSSGIGGDKTQGLKGPTDYWVVKTDSLGNKQWDKDFGGPSGDGNSLDAVFQTDDGGYILGGFSYSGIGGDKTQVSKGSGDYWIVKIDSLGNKQWDKDYGGAGDDLLYTLQPTADGGFILAGKSNSGVSGDKTQPLKGPSGGLDFWIVKIDSVGNKEWDKDFGGSSDEDDMGNASQTTDGGYLLAGTSYSNISGDKTENNLGVEQSWIVKTDSYGIKQWDKTLLTLPTHQYADDEMGFAVQAKGGCYLFANYTMNGVGGNKSQANWDATNTTVDIWVIKFCDTTNASVVLPQSAFLASDTMLCTNDCISFTNQSSNATSYQWFFAGGTPSSSTMQNPYVCYLASGTYDVKLIAANAGGKDSITFSNYIHVIPSPPSPTINQIGTTLYCSTDSTYISYQWFLDSTLIPGATGSSLTITKGGNYNVQVSNAFNCKMAGGIVLGLQNYANDNIISLSPNPATDELLISGNWKSEAGTLTIFNILGEHIYTAAIHSKQETVNCKPFPAGIYFVQVLSESGRWVGRFVKE